MNQEKYIQRCIDISKNGISAAAPNPSVGAILVYNQKIIGEGFTSPFGGKHAEVNCIESVSLENKEFIKKSTLYVSLEPCSHYGKTAPCSLLIIDSGIKRVVIGSLDPNPLVAGKGVDILQKKGIEVVSNVLKTKCEFVNRRFYTFYRKKRPYIILKWAESKKGYFAPFKKEQFWITNKNCKQLVHKWRTEEMAILVGTKTAKIDNPQLNSRLYKGKNPVRIVIDKDLELKTSLHLFDNKQETLVFNNNKSIQEGLVEYIKLNFTKNLITQILDILYIKGINSIIIEGGLFTINSFIEQKLWDESRVLIGENDLNSGIKAPSIEGKTSESFTLNNNSIAITINNLAL